MHSSAKNTHSCPWCHQFIPATAQAVCPEGDVCRKSIGVTPYKHHSVTKKTQRYFKKHRVTKKKHSVTRKNTALPGNTVL
jgi:hypothetical protein